jgi:hypothetical protein
MLHCFFVVVFLKKSRHHIGGNLTHIIWALWKFTAFLGKILLQNFL